MVIQPLNYKVIYKLICNCTFSYKNYQSIVQINKLLNLSFTLFHLY